MSRFKIRSRISQGSSSGPISAAGCPENAAKSSELIPTGTARGSESIAALNRPSSVDEVLRSSLNLTGLRSACKGAGRGDWWIGNLGKR